MQMRLLDNSKTPTLILLKLDGLGRTFTSIWKKTENFICQNIILIFCWNRAINCESNVLIMQSVTLIKTIVKASLWYCFNLFHFWAMLSYIVQVFYVGELVFKTGASFEDLHNLWKNYFGFYSINYWWKNKPLISIWICLTWWSSSLKVLWNWLKSITFEMKYRVTEKSLTNQKKLYFFVPAEACWKDLSYFWVLY